MAFYPMPLCCVDLSDLSTQYFKNFDKLFVCFRCPKSLVVWDAYFESKQIRTIGVLRGVASMCRKASATAESSAVLLVSTVAPRWNGSAGVMDTGPYSWVCVLVAKGASDCERWVK